MRWILFKSLLAGAIVALMAAFSTIALFHGYNVVLAGLLFSAALISVLWLKLELFTGNCLQLIPVGAGQVSIGDFLANLLLSLFGNAVGAVVMATIFRYFYLPLQPFSLTDKFVSLAVTRAAMPWFEALTRGIGCNFLLCWAVAIFYRAGKRLGPRFVATMAVSILVTLFIVGGFEHSVAGFFYGMMSWLLFQDINWVNFLMVILGNAIGGFGVTWIMVRK